MAKEEAEKVVFSTPVTKNDAKILNKQVLISSLGGTLQVAQVIYTLEGIGEVVFFGQDALDVVSLTENITVRDAKINSKLRQ